MIALDVQLAALEGAIPSEPPAQDERGTELLYRLLDAELAHERAVRELTEARAALAAYTASVRSAREPVATVATAPTEPKREHHPSFTRSEQRSFFGRLRSVCDRHGYDKSYAYDLAETVQRRIRPSAMTSPQRTEYLGWLESPEGIAAYEGFAAARLAELAAKVDAEGPTVRCPNCSAPHSSPIRCRACGWDHKAAA